MLGFFHLQHPSIYFICFMHCNHVSTHQFIYYTYFVVLLNAQSLALLNNKQVFKGADLTDEHSHTVSSTSHNTCCEQCGTHNMATFRGM